MILAALDEGVTGFPARWIKADSLPVRHRTRTGMSALRYYFRPPWSMNQDNFNIIRSNADFAIDVRDMIDQTCVGLVRTVNAGRRILATLSQQFKRVFDSKKYL